MDPIDGTTNFVRGFAYTNISVALAKDGQVEYAVVYAPLAGELYAARRGGGATLNGGVVIIINLAAAHSSSITANTGGAALNGGDIIIAWDPGANKIFKL